MTSDLESKVSTAQMPSSSSSSPAVSAIENEIANYRAITPLAIISLILGVFSVLAFANIYLAAISVAAIAAGALAIRKIQRFPDLYTGKVFAQAGIVIALIFGTSALTTMAVADLIRSTQAKGFARIYEEALKKGSIEDLLWYATPPETRKGKTPQQVSDDMAGSAKDKDDDGATLRPKLYSLKRAASTRRARTSTSRCGRSKRPTTTAGCSWPTPSSSCIRSIPRPVRKSRRTRSPP